MTENQSKSRNNAHESQRITAAVTYTVQYVHPVTVLPQAEQIIF